MLQNDTLLSHIDITFSVAIELLWSLDAIEKFNAVIFVTMRKKQFLFPKVGI